MLTHSAVVDKALRLSSNSPISVNTLHACNALHVFTDGLTHV